MMNNFKQVVAAPSSKFDEELEKLVWLPRGSALITSSGELEEQGIEAIIHAATGSMNNADDNPEYYEPTLESIENSIKNSFELLKTNGFSNIAVPFIGGNIFISRIGTTPRILANRIIESCFKYAGTSNFILVTHSGTKKGSDHDLFSTLLKTDYNVKNISAILKDGDICDFMLHNCEVIMNAANMEVEFGGGLSGVIANATNQRKTIDAEAKKYINEYYLNA